MRAAGAAGRRPDGRRRGPAGRQRRPGGRGAAGHPRTCSSSVTARSTTCPARPTRRRPGRRVEGWRAELARRRRRRARSCWPATGRRPRATRPAGRWPRRIAAGSGVTAVFAGQRPDGARACWSRCTRQGLRGARRRQRRRASTTCPRRRTSRPPLTTVRQDFAELGRRGVQLVLARLAGEPTCTRTRCRPTARARSTAPPAAGTGPRCDPDALLLALT